jgi:hypothetical protein
MVGQTMMVSRIDQTNMQSRQQAVIQVSNSLHLHIHNVSHGDQHARNVDKIYAAFSRFSAPVLTNKNQYCNNSKERIIIETPVKNYCTGQTPAVELRLFAFLNVHKKLFK